MENKNVKYCLDCGQPALVLEGPDRYLGPGCGKFTKSERAAPTTTNFHRFIAVKYCPVCAERHKREFNAKRQQAHRRKHKAEKMLLRRQITAQKKISLSKQRQLEREQERRKAAEDEVEDLREEIRRLRAQAEKTAAAAYQQGQREEAQRRKRITVLGKLFA